MKSRRFLFCVVEMVWLLCLAVPASFAADAKVTFNNKINRDVFVAVCWAKPLNDSEAVMWKKGWPKIEPGKSRSLTIPGIRNLFDVGYYAKSSEAKGQKELIWQGTSKEYALAGGIHPAKSFDTYECSIDGGMEVRFRKVKLKESGGLFTAAINLSN